MRAVTDKYRRIPPVAKSPYLKTIQSPYFTDLSVPSPSPLAEGSGKSPRPPSTPAPANLTTVSLLRKRALVKKSPGGKSAGETSATKTPSGTRPQVRHQ